MSLTLAVRLANARPLITPRGSSSISRVTTVLSDGVSQFIGNNSYRSHPFVKYFSESDSKICLHSELDALNKAVRYFSRRSGVSYKKSISHLFLSGFTASVARVLSNGEPALAKPCSVCQKALDHFKVSNIEWTT